MLGCFKTDHLKNGQLSNEHNADVDALQTTENPSSAQHPLTFRRGIYCTDIFCALIFFFFLAGQIFISVFAYYKGDALRLLYGYDCWGNTCNRMNYLSSSVERNDSNFGIDTRGRPFVFYFYQGEPSKSVHICVRKCPDRYIANQHQLLLYLNDTKNSLCAYNQTISQIALLEYERFAKDGLCPDLPVLPSSPMMGRCIPGNLSYLENEVVRWTTRNNLLAVLNEALHGQRLLIDAYKTLPEIIIFCGLAVVLSIVMMFVIRYITALIVYIVMIVMLVASFIACSFLWWTYAYQFMRNDALEAANIPLLEVAIDNERWFGTLAVLVSLLSFMLLLIICVVRKRVPLVVQLFHQATVCVTALPQLLLVSCCTLCLLAAFLAYWQFTLAYIATAVEPTRSSAQSCVKFDRTSLLQSMWVYHIFALLWFSQFILTCQQYVVVSVVIAWYFRNSDRDALKCRFPVLRSVSQLVQHHLGSIALGSLLISVVKLIRWFLMFVEKKLANSASEHCCVSCLRKCCFCFFFCLQRFLKYVHHNAYVIMALDGTNFYFSSRKAYRLVTSNNFRVAALNSMDNFLILLAKLTVTGLTSAAAVYCFKTRVDLHFWGVPVILVAFFAYYIAHCFLTLYEMTVDALLICYCDDCARNNGIVSGNYFMGLNIETELKNESDKLNLQQCRTRTSASFLPS